MYTKTVSRSGIGSGISIEKEIEPNCKSLTKKEKQNSGTLNQPYIYVENIENTHIKLYFLFSLRFLTLTT